MVSRLPPFLLDAYFLALCAFLASASASSGQTSSEKFEGRPIFGLAGARISGPDSKIGPAAGEPLRERIRSVRIPFVSNRGQTGPAVAYYASTFAGTVYVTKKGEIVYSLPALTRDGEKRSRPVARALGKAVDAGWTLTETPVAGRTRVIGEQRAVAQVSYFIGSDPERWQSGIATYETVGLGTVWPGVRLSLRAHGDNVEKLFTVAPGANMSRIRMRMTGAQSLRVNEAGALVAGTGLGEVTFTRPVAYQERAGVRRAVAVAYWAKGRQYGFSVRGHDPTLPVMIDPLLQATYLGGSSGEQTPAIAIHPITGEVFVAGFTGSTDFPGTAGGAQPVYGNSGDVFVARLDYTLMTLIQATYLGGSSGEQNPAIAIHPTTGDVYVTGPTSSTDFPGTAGGAQPSFGGGDIDAFVARLNATLTMLIQATYLGGGGEEHFSVVAIHPTTGEVFVAGLLGCAHFSCTNFPGTGGGAQPAPGGIGDSFVARLNATLTTLSQATYLGGSDGSDYVFALAIHPTTGEVFVAGTTASTDFPGTAGGAQPATAGGEEPFVDAFVARLNATLTRLIQTTYLGGSNFEEVTGLVIHPPTDEVFVTGVTGSTDFPRTAGGAQPIFGGGDQDGFVARLDATLTTLNQATYLGGSDGLDFDSALAIHPTTGEVFVAGTTASTDFPGTTVGEQPVPGSPDAFVARFNATLTELIQSIYLGGSSGEFANAMAIHPTTGDIFVAGDYRSEAGQIADDRLRGRELDGPDVTDHNAVAISVDPGMTQLIRVHIGGVDRRDQAWHVARATVEHCRESATQDG